MHTPINPNAPVRARQRIEIEATPGKCWEILTDIENWPAWQKNVSQAKLQGALAEGTVFRWKAGGKSLTSILHTVSPMSEFGWTGKTLGASAVHNWWLKERYGRTIVTVEESLQGWLPTLFRKSFQKQRDAGMLASLRELKAAAEKK